MISGLERIGAILGLSVVMGGAQIIPKEAFFSKPEYIPFEYSMDGDTHIWDLRDGESRVFAKVSCDEEFPLIEFRWERHNLGLGENDQFGIGHRLVTRRGVVPIISVLNLKGTGEETMEAGVNVAAGEVELISNPVYSPGILEVADLSCPTDEEEIRQ